jgi:hypothetical protein
VSPTHRPGPHPGPGRPTDRCGMVPGARALSCSASSVPIGCIGMLAFQPRSRPRLKPEEGVAPRASVPRSQFYTWRHWQRSNYILPRPHTCGIVDGASCGGCTVNVVTSSRFASALRTLAFLFFSWDSVHGGGTTGRGWMGRDLESAMSTEEPRGRHTG